MSIRDGIRDGIRTLTGSTGPSASGPARTVEASALLGPTEPAPELGSPWADSGQLSTILFQELVGDLDSVPVTRATAMAVPAIARARGMVCNTLARLDLFAADARTGVELPDVNAARFLDCPDPEQNRFVLITWTADDLIFYGVSWWLILARFADGKPRAARRILPGGVAIDKLGRITVYGKPADRGDLIRIDGPHEGILTFGGPSLRAAAALEKSSARFSTNPVPAIELHQTDDYPMSDPEIDKLISRWAAARNGANGGVAYTTRNIDAKVHGAPAEHLLTKGRNAAAIDGARLVGTPADSVDASVEHASMTYQTSEGRNRVLIDYGLAAYGAAITARLSMPDVTPRGQAAEFRYDQITAATDAAEGTPAPPSTPGGQPPAASVTTKESPA